MSVKELVDQWLAWDRNKETREEIEKLWNAKNEAELLRLLGKRMEFGTAGLRSRMGAGNSQMNHLTIIQTAQGLAAYLKSQFTAEELLSRGIVLGFDGRYHSDEFAKLTAAVMKAAGIRTYLYDRVVPTPFVAFGIRHLKCVSGVMVTASHNPKMDNGYKVYWSNGAQIVSPHDKGIAAAIEKNLVPLESSWEMYAGDVNPYDDVFAAYYGTLMAQYKPQGHGDVRFVYSAMHGVGAPFTLHSLSLMGVPKEDVIVVKEQEKPDPEFPTVEFPNPEEGKTSLDLSIKTGNSSGATVILANDPDADRLAVAEKREDGTWRLFNGNEIGAMLGWWATHLARQRGDDLSKCHLLSSTVSSPILGTIAAKEGMHFHDTLTGFKWMGSVSETLERETGDKVLLAFEEAIGFMWGNRVYDKDGVTAAGVFADMARWVKKEEGLNLAQKLKAIYEMYGYHFSCNSYVISRDAAKTRAMFNEITTMENGSYPTTVAGAKVKHIRDLATGLDTRMPDKKATLPLSPSSPMLTFYFDNGVTMTIRGSGTEPKLKWYTALVTSDPQGEPVLIKFVRDAVNELVKPEKFGFQRRPEDVVA